MKDSIERVHSHFCERARERIDPEIDASALYRWIQWEIAHDGSGITRKMRYGRTHKYLYYFTYNDVRRFAVVYVSGLIVRPITILPENFDIRRSRSKKIKRIRGDCFKPRPKRKTRSGRRK